MLKVMAKPYSLLLNNVGRLAWLNYFSAKLPCYPARFFANALNTQQQFDAHATGKPETRSLKAVCFLGKSKIGLQSGVAQAMAKS